MELHIIDKILGGGKPYSSQELRQMVSCGKCGCPPLDDGFDLRYDSNGRWWCSLRCFNKGQ